MKKKGYIIILVVSFVLFVLSFSILANTVWLGGMTMGGSIYLFFGSIIKICKTNDKLRDLFVCAIDLLFWLP